MNILGRLFGETVQHVDATIRSTVLVLDGHEFIRCRIIDSRIVVTRGNFRIEDCSFDRCTFEFAGEAASVRGLVLALQQQETSGGQEPLSVTAETPTNGP